MSVDGARSGDQPFATDDGCTGADDDIDVVLHIGVARTTDTANAALADSDADLADPTGGVDDDDVGDHHVACVAHRSRFQ